MLKFGNINKNVNKEFYLNNIGAYTPISKFKVLLIHIIDLKKRKR